MAVVEKKRRGRPAKAPVEGERIPLSLRVTAELKRDLEQAAGGRSLSQEAEYRLSRSFADERLFSSPRLHRWAILLADQFHRAGTSSGSWPESPTTDDAWMDDPQALAGATYSAMRALLRNLAQDRRVDPDDVAIYLDNLKAAFINELVAAGRARIVDKDGKPVSGFIECTDGEDGTR